MPRTKTPFADAVVFVVGGGNYIEHQNLQVENDTPKPRINKLASSKMRKLKSLQAEKLTN